MPSKFNRIDAMRVFTNSEWKFFSPTSLPVNSFNLISIISIKIPVKMSALQGKACVSTMCDFLNTHVSGQSFMFPRCLDFTSYSSKKSIVFFHLLPIIILVTFLLCLKNFLYFLGTKHFVQERHTYLLSTSLTLRRTGIFSFSIIVSSVIST